MRLALVLVPALLAVTPAWANCANPEQMKALQLRQFHYQLQVAALNCRGDDPSLPGKWQDYIRRHAAILSDNARVLRAFFKSDGALDRHNTVVTNRESGRVHETHDYCELRGPQFDKALSLTGHQLTAYAAETVGEPDNAKACKEQGKSREPAKKTSKTN